MRKQSADFLVDVLMKTSADEDEFIVDTILQKYSKSRMGDRLGDTMEDTQDYIKDNKDDILKYGTITGGASAALTGGFGGGMLAKALRGTKANKKTMALGAVLGALGAGGFGALASRGAINTGIGAMDSFDEDTKKTWMDKLRSGGNSLQEAGENVVDSIKDKFNI